MTSLFPSEDTHGRQRDDFYRTPAPCTQALVEELKCHGIEPRTILDVGCGDGGIGRVLRQAWPETELWGVESNLGRCTTADKAIAREDPRIGNVMVYNHVWHRLYENGISAPRTPDLIISNPPFRHALRFLELALQRVRPGGHVCFLLPSQWDQETNQDAEGRPRERGRFLDKLRLPDGREGYRKLNYEGRVGFRGDGKTDRITYTWYVFGPGFEGAHTRIPRYAAEKSEQLRIEGT
jgi:SAM-dependent methyltransferase